MKVLIMSPTHLPVNMMWTRNRFSAPSSANQRDKEVQPVDDLKIKELVDELFKDFKDRSGGACCCCCCCCCCVKKDDPGKA